ncbi:MAG: hypothetical protein LBV80_08025 [Deltaproteobacteria bacterium]|jgi:hypothetical protein|nr:hypothetical protein [Deltaproteobacteria bacterium]
MEWLRWFHGCVTDPKFSLIARRSGQTLPSTLAVWAALLERASQAQDRGCVEGFDCDSFDALFGLEDGACQKIMSAIEAKGLIVDGRIAKWDERQNKDESAAERKRLQREREKLSQEKAELEALRAECHAMSQDVTAGHAMSPRLDKIREEKKEEKYNPPVSNTGKEGTCAPAPSDSGVCDLEFSNSCSQAENAQDEPPSPESVDLAGDMPGIEFVELREYYSREAKPEAELAGFIEYKQLRASRLWPGLSVVFEGIDRLKAKDSEWQRGFAPGLARFLRERQWTMQPRAAPEGRALPGQSQSWIDRANSETTAAIEEMERQRQAKKRNTA